MLFCVGDYAFAGHLPLESADCAFNTFVIVNLYSSHSKTSKIITIDYASRLGPRRRQARLCAGRGLLRPCLARLFAPGDRLCIS
jgi:hypothetical protein